MKRGGLGGAILLAALAVGVLALNRTHTPPRAPTAPVAPPPAEVPPEPPDTATPEPEPAAKPGARLVGRVTDEEGLPIAGAELLLAERNLPGKVVARTGDDGRYVADGVEGKDLLVGAIAKGHAPSDLHPIGAPERPVYEIDFALRRGGGSLSLVIRAADGKDPEATVIVDPFFTEELEELLDDEAPGGHRVVSTQGGATVEGLVPEWNRVLVLARGYAPVFLPVRLHPGGPVEASVLLKTGATLVGTVRTPEGAPVPEAKVRTVAWAWRSFATTAADGAYRIEHLPEGRLEMEAEGVGGQAWAFLELEDGKESRWDPVLRPAAVISGRVVEEDGSPVARARMSCTWSGRNETEGWDGLETALDGAFRFEGCRDAAHVVSVRRPGAKGLPAAEISVRPSDSPVTITLPRGEGYFRGTVVDRNGAPAADATMRAWRAARPDREVRARTAADGSFRVGPLPPGPYLVELHLDGEPTRHLRPEIEIVAGETLELGVIRFPVGGRIRASVVDMAGGVLPHEEIEVLSLDGSITFAGESDGGVFVSEELTPGNYLVRAAKRGLVEEVSVAPGGVVSAELRLRPGSRLRVMTVRADGQPIDATFRVEDLKGHVLRDYHFRTTVYLAEGDYRVLGRDDHALRGEAAVRIGRDEREVQLVLVLE